MGTQASEGRRKHSDALSYILSLDFSGWGEKAESQAAAGLFLRRAEQSGFQAAAAPPRHRVIQNPLGMPAPLDRG